MFLLPFSAFLAAFGAAFGCQLVCNAAEIAQPWFPQLSSQLLATFSQPGPASTILSIVMSFSGAWFAFVIMPIMDLLLGRDVENGTEGSTGSKNEGDPHRWLLYSYVLVHWLVLGAACQVVANATLHPLAFLGVAVSLGSEGGLVFTAAHELLHSRKPLEMTLSSCLLASVGYMHWENAHLAHHVNVATPWDPASARLGESLYAFIPRSVIGGVVDAIRMEAGRLKAQGLPLLSLSNRMLHWLAIPCGLLAAAAAIWGQALAALLLLQGAVAVFMLEDVNYVEHYGLVRRKGASGRPERVAPHHSWNANWLFTNAVVLRLQRHSHHHERATTPFQELRDLPEDIAPQLPASYPAMMLLATVPPLFFAVMNPLALQARQRYARVGVAAGMAG